MVILAQGEVCVRIRNRQLVPRVRKASLHRRVWAGGERGDEDLESVIPWAMSDQRQVGES